MRLMHFWDDHQCADVITFLMGYNVHYSILSVHHVGDFMSDQIVRTVATLFSSLIIIINYHLRKSKLWR